MIRRILIVLMIMLTTIGSAQTCLPSASFAAPAQTEILMEPDVLSHAADRDIGHAHDGDHWTRRQPGEAWPSAWKLVDVSYYPDLPIYLEGRMRAPIYRPPIVGGPLSHPDPLARAA